VERLGFPYILDIEMLHAQCAKHLPTNNTAHHHPMSMCHNCMCSSFLLLHFLTISIVSIRESPAYPEAPNIYTSGDTGNAQKHPHDVPLLRDKFSASVSSNTSHYQHEHAMSNVDDWGRLDSAVLHTIKLAIPYWITIPLFYRLPHRAYIFGLVQHYTFLVVHATIPHGLLHHQKSLFQKPCHKHDRQNQ